MTKPTMHDLFVRGFWLRDEDAPSGSSNRGPVHDA
jgi:hypothetical protein